MMVRALVVAGCLAETHWEELLREVDWVFLAEPSYG